MAEEATEGAQRVDKWLCYARFARTRTVAQAMVEGGKVRVNKIKVKQPSRLVRTDDVLTIRLPRAVRVVRILGMADRRLSPPAAAALYESLDAD
ncbi:MAG: RNA-binding S4 domain-containing protein [Devosia sp.]